MKTNMQQWAETIFSSKKRQALPIMTHPGIEFIGKSVKDAVTDGKVHFQAIQALQENFPLIAATMIMDLTVEAEAFGSPVHFSEHEVPVVTSRIVSDLESVEQLMVPTFDSGRIPQYLEAARLAAQNIQNVPVIAGCIGPFSLAGRLFDMTEIMTAAYMEPETIALLLRKCTDFLLTYIEAFKKTGVHGIVIAEPAAGMLSEELCDEFSSIYVKELVDALQDDHFMIILHNCGNTGHVTRSMVSTGAKGLHFGNKIDMVKVLREVPADIMVMGNLDPVGVFKMADKATVAEATRELLDKTKGHSNFVISSGCDTPPGVPIENIHAFFGAVEEY
jgi:uroporphyrinogen decarboxylase